MKALGTITTPKDVVNAKYINERYHVWKADVTYAANAWVVHNGYLWHNTSGATSTGVEPGTNYNVWNVNYSNRNQVDNPWFSINSRGQTIYTSGYSVDRWKVTQGSINVTVNSDGTITLTNTYAGDSRFSCIMEKERINSFFGKSIYTSVDVIDFSGDIDVFIQEKNSPWRTIVNGLYLTHTGINAKKMNSNAWSQGQFEYPFQFCVQLHENASVTLRSVKFELGSVSTLYNDTIPDYGTEFVKCVTSTADSTDTYANKTLLTT